MPTSETAGEFTVAVTGDMILNNRVSVCRDPGFLELVELLRGTDVVHAQFEYLIGDGVGPEVYPAAEAAWAWRFAPRYVAEELQWMGVNLVSLASNVAFDYSYGGLRDTIAAMDAVGMPHAGTGADLAAARAPAFLDTAHGRVALVSACSSTANSARAGAARSDVPGRPGVNPLRYYHRVDHTTAERIIELFTVLGYWVTILDDEFTVNPPGLHNTLWRFAISDEDGVTTVPDENDVTGNLAAIRHGLHQADFVIAHVHTHEWDAADGRMSSSPAFVETYARAAIDEGAHVVIVQGSHSPLRGIEIHRGRPIFYDTGDILGVGGRWSVQPDEFYRRWGHDGPETRRLDAGVPEVFGSHMRLLETGKVPSPRTIYTHGLGFFVPVLTVRDDYSISGVTIHPGANLTGSRAQAGLPSLAKGERAQAILQQLDELCRPYNTKLQIDGEQAYIDLDD